MQKFPFEIILDWYQDNGRHELPWRLQQSPYHVWISEIFLQQTQVERVKDYFNRVIEAFPTVEDFAKLSYDEFFPYYKWLGYYSRARNMLKTAEIIVWQYDGVFPDNYNDLVNLPWVWPYTAQAILSFWHNQNILAFDTNIEKIFARYYYGNKFHKLSKQDKQELQEMFENFCSPPPSPLPSKEGGSNSLPLPGGEMSEGQRGGRDMNAAMMDFSTLIDINQIQWIDFDSYPLRDSEFYKSRGNMEVKPNPKTPLTPPLSGGKKNAKLVVILHENHKRYFSAHPDNFAAFMFDPHNWDHRHYVQEIFQKKYDLELSVRPVYKKIASPKWNYFFYHAQIQSWTHEFGEFSKSEKAEWENNF